MSKRKRILIVLAVVAVVSGGYLWFFGVQTMCALFARYKFRTMPDVAKTPVALTDLSISGTPHKKVSYFGYEFELPWDDIDEQKDRIVGTIHVTYFHSGNAFWFSTFPPKEFVNTVLETTKLGPEAFRQIYGDEAFQSDYGFKRRMLQTAPGGISPFMSQRQATAGMELLLIKAISMPKADSGIFSIQTRDFQGFQFGNPQIRPFKITDELYAEGGGLEFIFLQKVDGPAPSISQPEINRILQTIRKVPAKPAARNTN